MAVNIHLNLKTINGQPISGSGNMEVSTTNWRGSFSSAPIGPAKYDAYHNTADGNSYIFSGTTWGMLAQKGDNSNSIPSGMFFPHDTLTSDDVGKLVIWKDDKAQLPVFEPAAPAMPGVVIYNMNLSEFTPYQAAYIDFVFSSNPEDGDAIEGYIFRTSLPVSKEVLIGPSISDTIDQFISVLADYEISNYKIRRTAQRIGSDTLRISFLGDGLYGYWSWTDDVLAGFSISGDFAVRTSYGDTVLGRLNDALVPFLLFYGLGLTNDEPIKSSLYADFYTNTAAFTQPVLLGDWTEGFYPANLSELKAGIIENLLKLDFVVGASWENDDDLVVGFSDRLPTQININSGDEAFWSSAFDNGFVFYEPSPSLPSYCKYPIIGLVKAVTSEQVEIHSEPLCSFKLTGDDMIWEGLSDFQRFCVLNPDEPGYLMSLANVELNSIEVVFTLTEAGYFTAIDKNVTSGQSFYGSLSFDRYPLSILKFALAQEGN